MRRAVRMYLRQVVLVLATTALGIACAAFIITHQNVPFPAWVPFVGEHYVTYEGEFSSARGIVPGQGQPITVAGIRVGLITRARLREGRAVITFRIKRRDARIFRDASLLLRPRTALKDMTVELTPGTPSRGRLPEGSTIAVRETLTDVNPDEIFAALDADTRAYLVALLNGAGRGVRGQGETLAAVFRRFEPTARDLDRVTAALSSRRVELRRVVENFRLLSEELARNQDAIARLISGSNAVFGAMAGEQEALANGIGELPATVGALDTSMRALAPAATDLGAGLRTLSPGTRATPGALRDARALFAETTGVVANELRPLTREVRPAVRASSDGAEALNRSAPSLSRSLQVLNRFYAELAYNPPGDAEEGFLFWMAWAAHQAASVVSAQDALGPVPRAMLVSSCTSLRAAPRIIDRAPALGTILELLDLPREEEVCRSKIQ